MLMLIKHDAALAMERAWKLGARATTAQAEEWSTKIQAASNAPPNLTIAGEAAEIRVEGVLSKKPDFLSWLLFGANTTYESIQQALVVVEANPSVKRVSMLVDSPGGYVDGLFDTLGALEAFSKPMSVRGVWACSAAYAIAAIAGPIEAGNEASEFGSIGVAASYFVDESVIDITSSEAPNKRPDPTTPEGKAVIVAELDAIHDLFVSAIARGRGTTTDDVNARYGRGGVLLAAEAKKRGMIDRITKPAARASSRAALENSPAPAQPTEAATEPVVQVVVPEALIPASAESGGRQPTRKKSMTKEELQTQHPELYAAVRKEGTDQERKRVLAHLKLGEASGDMNVARDAIAAGASTLDEDVHAAYLSAHMNRRDQAARQQDSDSAGSAVNGSTPKPGESGGADAVADAMERLLKGGTE